MWIFKCCFHFVNTVQTYSSLNQQPNLNSFQILCEAVIYNSNMRIFFPLLKMLNSLKKKQQQQNKKRRNLTLDLP